MTVEIPWGTTWPNSLPLPAPSRKYAQPGQWQWKKHRVSLRHWPTSQAIAVEPRLWMSVSKKTRETRCARKRKGERERERETQQCERARTSSIIRNWADWKLRSRNRIDAITFQITSTLLESSEIAKNRPFRRNLFTLCDRTVTVFSPLGEEVSVAIIFRIAAVFSFLFFFFIRRNSREKFRLISRRESWPLQRTNECFCRGGGGGRMLREIEVTADLPTFRNRKKFPAIKRAERAQALNRGFYS